MYPTVFRIARPFVQRYLTKRAAQYAADYLNRWREQRQQAGTLEPDSSSVSSDVPVIEDESIALVPVPVGFSGSDLFWYTLSGVLFGGALGVILAYTLRQDD